MIIFLEADQTYAGNCTNCKKASVMITTVGQCGITPLAWCQACTDLKFPEPTPKKPRTSRAIKKLKTPH